MFFNEFKQHINKNINRFTNSKKISIHRKKDTFLLARGFPLHPFKSALKVH